VSLSLAELAQAVGTLLKERGETIAVAESSSGGLISAALLAIPGASKYYRGGGVIYTLVARTELLRADAEAVRGLRSSSEPYAQFLAERVRTQLGATWGIGETGAAGPTGNRYGDKAGHSGIAVAGPRPRSITVETGIDDREANMWTFTRRALALLEACLGEKVSA
jgi:nicotinamide-nucleotide amidase